MDDGKVGCTANIYNHILAILDGCEAEYNMSFKHGEPETGLTIEIKTSHINMSNFDLLTLRDAYSDIGSVSIHPVNDKSFSIIVVTKAHS